MANGYATGSDELLRLGKQIDDVNSQTQNTLKGLNGKLEILQSAWSGNAATAFHQLLERFNEDTAKLQQALQSISEQITGTAQTYIQQEEEHSSSLSNINSRLG